jgi:ribonuclease R
VTVRIAEAVAVTGGLTLELLEIEGKALPRGKQRPARGPAKRKMVKEKRKRDRIERKVKRKRK